MGDGSSTSTIKPIAVPPSPPPSSPLQTSTILSTLISVVLPTFEGVMNEPITLFFTSQSIEPDMMNNEDDDDNEDVMVGFSEFEFNLEEDNVCDTSIIFGKQFKILNSKLNSILHLFK